jgi:hypothetical protein
MTTVLIPIYVKSLRYNFNLYHRAFIPGYTLKSTLLTPKQYLPIRFPKETLYVFLFLSIRVEFYCHFNRVEVTSVTSLPEHRNCCVSCSVLLALHNCQFFIIKSRGAQIPGAWSAGWINFWTVAPTICAPSLCNLLFWHLEFWGHC